MNEIVIDNTLIKRPKIIKILNGSFECFTNPNMAISTSVKKLFFVKQLNYDNFLVVKILL